MALRITKDEAYARGREAAEHPLVTGDLVKDTEALFPLWKREFPLSAHLDYRTEIVKLWRERMSAEPDLTRYPECRGLPEIVRAEHQGYLDGCGGNEVQAAYRYNAFYFLRLRLQTRYFGFPDGRRGQSARNVYSPPATACTAVWFEDTPDGPVNGKNLDSGPEGRLGPYIPHHIPYGRPIRGVRLMGTATAACFCDEEPEEIFPVNLDDILPEDIRTVEDYVQFRHRYRQFCGPGNFVFVDEQGRSAAVEQTNCRMAWRFSAHGISAVTALAYLDPDLHRYKLECDRRSLEKRGWGEDCPDWVYWRGCDARYARLRKLTEEIAKRGATVEAMARLLLDPEATPPERISCANERYHPDIETNFWTVYTWVEVVFGPARRTYRWEQPTQPTEPIFKRDPEVFPGEGVQMQPRFREERDRLARIGK